MVYLGCLKPFVLLFIALLPVDANSALEWIIKRGARLIPGSDPDKINEIRPTAHLFKRGDFVSKHKYCGGFRFAPDSIDMLTRNQDRLAQFSRSLYSQKEIIIASHGWRGKLCGGSWRGPLVNSLHVAKRSANILFVDWAQGARSTFFSPYSKAAANVEVVGQEIVKFLNRLGQFFNGNTTTLTATLNSSNVHCIGFSLGSHVCSSFCRHIYDFTNKERKCDRLSALDPAGVRFHDLGPGSRVSKQDADFVDAYHSSKVGLTIPVGHVDIFINDLEEPQPGCGKRFGSFGKCSHNVAAKFFAKSAWKIDNCFDLDCNEPSLKNTLVNCTGGMIIGVRMTPIFTLARIDIKRSEKCWITDLFK